MVVGCSTDDGSGERREGSSLLDGSAGGVPDRVAPDAALDRSADGPEVPDGYPPSHCIPPCLWKLFLECKVPGVGGPAATEASCIRTDRSACDLTTGFYMDSSGGYVMGGRCFTVVTDIPCSAPGCLTDWTQTYVNAAGQVVAVEHALFVGGSGDCNGRPPFQAHSVECAGEPVAYSVDDTGPECGAVHCLLPWLVNFGHSLSGCREGTADECSLPGDAGPGDGSALPGDGP